MRRYIYVAGLALAVMATAPLHAQGPAGTGQPAIRSTETPASDAARRYVEKSAVGNLFEIEAGRLAAERGSDAKVKEFGRRMADDHGRLSTHLKQALQPPNQGVQVPAGLDQAHEQMLSELKGARGADFDRLYLQMQEKAHEAALDLHTAYAAGGDHSELRSVAETARSIVQEHLGQLRAIKPGA